MILFLFITLESFKDKASGMRFPIHFRKKKKSICPLNVVKKDLQRNDVLSYNKSFLGHSWIMCYSLCILISLHYYYGEETGAAALLILNAHTHSEKMNERVY